MKEPRRDDERLSALLAGRLEGPERDELLDYLSTADEDLEVFAHTAAILREMDEEDAQEAARNEGSTVHTAPSPGREVPVPSMTRSTRGWPRKTPRWAIPSAIVGLVVLMTLTLSRGRTPDVSPVQLAENIGVAGPGLPFDTAQPSRGIPGLRVRGGSDAELTPESAAKAGAFLVRLALAIEARNASATRTLALQTQERFDPRGGSKLREIASRAGAPRAELQPLLTQAKEQLEDRRRRDAGYLRLGAWTEAGRLAASQRNAGYFGSEDSADMIDSAKRLTKDDPQGRAAVAAIQRELEAEGGLDLTRLETHFTALLAAIAT
ncbi:hypothetical protein [Longimicrobium sp.]|uniref:hypothetical protein n=1 Tax=Longimicrobium sp. TaxID=2029185 RepID=UPI003B3A4CEB